MRLTDLEPRWFAEEGRRGQGVVFRCPHCRAGYLCVTFANPLDGGSPFDIGTEECRPIHRLWDLLYGPIEQRDASGIVPRGTWIVPPGHLWQRAGETFDDLTLSPSVDASRAGCWHGFITKGEVR